MKRILCDCCGDRRTVGNYVVFESIVICHSCAMWVLEAKSNLDILGSHPFFDEFYGVDGYRYVRVKSKI